ncbi:MAG: alpha/beta hydrolase [Propionibacteriales bacterium]|nr:alpha/beta hydrolase [Propionibacteriales bacterium]
MPIATTSLSGGSTAVHYDTYGNPAAPTVVLIHGTGADARQWLHLANHLKDRFHILALDLAGSGRTTGPEGSVALDDLASQVRAVVHHAGINSYHLLGHSLGAMVAASIAAASPQRIASLVLHAGWVHADVEMTATFEQWRTLLATGGNALLAEAIALQAFGPHYWAGVADLDTHRRLVAQMASTIAPGTDLLIGLDLAIDLTTALSAITAPTLLLHSRHDRIVPKARRDALSASLPHAHVVELDQGHAAPAIDPDGFAVEVSRFLATHARPRHSIEHR